MDETTNRLAVDGHGVKPTTSKPVPTFLEKPALPDPGGTRGAGRKPVTPKPAPGPAAEGKGD
jgi:hypothetical protein